MKEKVIEAILKSLYKRGLITDAEREKIIKQVSK